MMSSAPARRLLRFDLAGHDATDLRLVQPAPGLDTFDLKRLGEVDDQHAVGELVLTGLEQQRDGEDGVGASGLCQLLLHLGADAGVQDSFEALTCRRIIKHQGRAIRRGPGRPLLSIKCSPKAIGNIREGGTRGSGQRMGDLVGVDDRDAALREQGRYRALAAADAAGQRDGERESSEPTPAQIGLGDGLAPDKADPAGDGQERAEGDGRSALAATAGDQRDAEQGARDRRQQQDLRQRLPAEPGAEQGQQLEVTAAHALLAGQQPEQMKHQPQAHIAGSGADDGRLAVDEQALHTEQQPEPEQRQRDVVRQQLRVDVDGRQRDQPPCQDQRKAPCSVGPNCQMTISDSRAVRASISG
jgi:hypothetical protein